MGFIHTVTLTARLENDLQEYYQRVTGKFARAASVLFHNAAVHTPEALPGVIEFLIENGYSIVPVSELIITGEHTIDHTGRQFPK
jgi:peptidoglycan/xylan/chitin deacetylase (PgdA/CDA1 family)